MNAIRLYFVGCALLLILTLRSAPASAQTPPAAVIDPNASTVVQELEVLARPPGPALWTVRRGEASVVILGGFAPLPHMLEWNAVRVERALNGAGVVLLPPRGRPGFLDALSLVFHQGDARLGGGRTLTDLMTPQEKARFEDMRVKIHTDMKRYDGLKPAMAGFILLSDFRKAAGLSDAKPASTVARMAQAKHVPIKTIGQLKLAQLFRIVAGMDAEQNRRCLDAALTDAEWEASRAKPVSSAWAEGDLKAVRADYHGALLDQCLLSEPSVQAMLDKGVAEGVKAIEAALEHPGKTVAVIDLSLLLRPDGVLDRLKAEGDDISIPIN